MEKPTFKKPWTVWREDVQLTEPMETIEEAQKAYKKAEKDYPDDTIHLFRFIPVINKYA